MKTASAKVGQLGSAIFSEIAEWKSEARENGHSIIDLGIGSPDRPPSRRVMKALQEAAGDGSNYGYPASEGTEAFRQAVADWYAWRFGVTLDAEREVLALIGSQDGLAHLAMAIGEPGDTALVPDPGYPIYAAGLTLAGVRPYYVPLLAENGFLPVLEEIPEQTARKAKWMLLNYPSNPLSAVAGREFFEQWVRFAERYDLILVHDLAYSEMAFDGFRPPSLLQVPGAKERAVEFHSLSKSFNMAGCRIGFAVGNADLLEALRKLKSNIDYGIFLPIQKAGIEALREDMETSGSVAEIYERRRNLMVDGLRRAGWHVEKPQATMFVWAPVPHGWSSRQISREILRNTGVVVVPGNAFGERGEGYVRIAMVQEEKVLEEAVSRIGRFLREREIHVL